MPRICGKENIVELFQVNLDRLQRACTRVGLVWTVSRNPGWPLHGLPAADVDEQVEAWRRVRGEHQLAQGSNPALVGRAW